MKIWKISSSFCNLTHTIDEFNLTFEFFYSQRHCSLSIPASSDSPQPTTFHSNFSASSKICFDNSPRLSRDFFFFFFLFFILIRYSMSLLLYPPPLNLMASILGFPESPRTSFAIPFSGLRSLLSLIRLALVSIH